MGNNNTMNVYYSTLQINKCRRFEKKTIRIASLSSGHRGFRRVRSFSFGFNASSTADSGNIQSYLDIVVNVHHFHRLTT